MLLTASIRMPSRAEAVHVEQCCPTCGHAMVTLGESDGEVALMCGYCTYSCTVLAGAGPVRADEEPA
jgi:transcription elongation factor Elf1